MAAETPKDECDMNARKLGVLQPNSLFAQTVKWFSSLRNTHIAGGNLYMCAN